MPRLTVCTRLWPDSCVDACRAGAHSSLMFCTNGVLLRMLTGRHGLQDVTHIVVDEIHERDKFADFLLIMVRKRLPSLFEASRYGLP